MKARGLVTVALLVLAACSRPGTLLGDVFVKTPSGEVSRAARISVSAVPATEVFERDWAAAVTAYRGEIEAARQVQKAAADSLDQARLAWGQTLAARRSAGPGANRRIKIPRTSGHDRRLYKQMLEADRELFKAKNRVREVARQHDERAVSVLEKHTAQRVQTDENGHYVLAALPTGKVYVSARFTVAGQTRVWFHHVRVRVWPQRLNLTEANSGGWPFMP
jgi:hypothetical protein